MGDARVLQDTENMMIRRTQSSHPQTELFTGKHIAAALEMFGWLLVVSSTHVGVLTL